MSAAIESFTISAKVVARTEASSSSAMATDAADAR
jgi:hypothetical protein